MQQLHRRKLRELDELMAHPETIERQIEALERECNSGSGRPDPTVTDRLAELRIQLRQARSKELLTCYLMDFMPFADEDADIQCEFTMKHKQARDDQERRFELSQQMNARLQDLTRRYKQRFWPCLCSGSSNADAPYEPLQTLDVEDLYDVDGGPLNDTRRCTYRRINHFREYLRQQQGKSRVVIPPEILDILRAELRKHHIQSGRCTPQIVRYLLKNLNQTATRSVPHKTNKLSHQQQQKHSGPKLQQRQPQQPFSWCMIYEHTPTITILLNPAFRLIDIPPERERLLCHLFEKTEAPFEKYKLTVKKARKNFLSYPYMTYKLCELLGWDEYLPSFALLKSDDLLILQDCYLRLI
jgi:hypothetical protein